MAVFLASMKPETRINWIRSEYIDRMPSFQSFTVLKLYMGNKGIFCRKKEKFFPAKT